MKTLTTSERVKALNKRIVSLGMRTEYCAGRHWPFVLRFSFPGNSYKSFREFWELEEEVNSQILDDQLGEYL